MAEVQNSEMLDRLRSETELQQTVDKVPTKLSEVIVPIIDVSNYRKETTKVISNVCINSTTTALFTTPANKDFYVTSVTLILIKDITSTSTFSGVTASIFGSGTTYIAYIPSLTLTVHTESITIQFPNPLRLNRNTVAALALNNNTNVANITSGATVCGFFVERH